MAGQVTQVYKTKTPVDAGAVWNGSLLPDAAALDAVLPAR
jgi:NitT/TauT family transport system substrate-binding protein